MVKTHCGKLWAISPFLAVFSNDLYCRHVKTRACLGKGWLSNQSYRTFAPFPHFKKLQPRSFAALFWFELFVKGIDCTRFITLKKKASGKHGGKQVKLLKMSIFTFFNNVFYAIFVIKSFNSHISVVVFSFFEFGTVSKWSIREWVKDLYRLDSWQTTWYFDINFETQPKLTTN